MFCHKCSYPINNDTYCRNCGEFTGIGERYPDDQNNAPKKDIIVVPKEKIKPFPIIMGIIVIISLLLSAIFLGFNLIVNK